MKAKDVILDIKKISKGDGRIASIYFVACGGSFAGFYPAKYLLERESKTLITAMFTSNEFVHAPPKACGKNSIVVLCSMRGTKETCEAAKVAGRLGARTIALYVQESELVTACDYSIQYQSISLDESKIENVNASIALRIAFEILYEFEEYKFYDAAMESFGIIDTIYRDALEYSIQRAKKFAAECKDDKLIYVLGGGPSIGAAYIFSICNLMEMQWVHSPTINSGEFLHGPFEATDKNTPYLILMSEGRTRPVDERALNFLKKYGERLYILDAKELGINRISDSVSEFFNHLLFSSILNNVYLRELSYAKKHPYTNRRYMWKVEY